MKVWLEVISGPRVNEKIELWANQIRVIGRLSEAEESFPDDVRMSARHFAILMYQLGWWIEDLQSSNGTRVDGRRIHAAKLRDHAEIIAGTTSFRFRIERDGPNETVATAMNRTSRFRNLCTTTQLKVARVWRVDADGNCQML